MSKRKPANLLSSYTHRSSLLGNTITTFRPVVVYCLYKEDKMLPLSKHKRKAIKTKFFMVLGGSNRTTAHNARDQIFFSMTYMTALAPTFTASFIFPFCLVCYSWLPNMVIWSREKKYTTITKTTKHMELDASNKNQNFTILQIRSCKKISFRIRNRYHILH